MSTLRVNNLTNQANDGGIDFAVQPVIDGLCKAWVNFNGTSTVAIRASYNVSTITDNGPGDYTVNFATAMPDANYAVNLTSGGTTARTTANSPGGAGSFSTTSCPVVSFIDSTSSFTDQAFMSVSVFR